MKRPGKARIGWADWSIVYLDEESWIEDERLDNDNGGETHTATHSIFVRLAHPSGTLNDAMIAEVLLHEILHALLAMSAMTHLMPKLGEEDLEESVVASLSGPLLAVWRDNPEVQKYLLGR